MIQSGSLTPAQAKDIAGSELPAYVTVLFNAGERAS